MGNMQPKTLIMGSTQQLQMAAPLKVEIKSALPPSPPNSLLGSDSESQVSTLSVKGLKRKATPIKAQLAFKATKLSSLHQRAAAGLSVSKQLRQQSYATLKANAKHHAKQQALKQQSIAAIRNNNGPHSVNSNSSDSVEEDCWPFLCSLSVNTSHNNMKCFVYLTNFVFFTETTAIRFIDVDGGGKTDIGARGSPGAFSATSQQR